jgi:hypothetical protein
VKLLSVGNTKTIKGEKRGYRTYIMHLAPSKLSGYNVCPMASTGCAAACLNTAGRGQFNKVQAARIKKTKWFFEDRDSFMAQLVKDIQAAERDAARHNLIPVIRLNGTSDIRWEIVRTEREIKGVLTEGNIMSLFPHIRFYDYTKLNRANLPKNYTLTFSRSESNSISVERILETNTNIAVVFGVKKDMPLPKKWGGRRVIDGDLDDLRFKDPKNVIVGLRGKGRARKKTFNDFVVTV